MPRRVLRPVLRGAAFLALAVLAAPADAADWRILPDESRISFTYTEGPETRTGFFTNFSGAFFFDPGNPETARAEIIIDVSRIDLDDLWRETVLQSPPWFHAEENPESRFTLSALRPLGENRYEATGRVEIKGIEKDIATPVSVILEGDSATARATMTFNRLDFRLRDAPLEAFVEIGKHIRIDALLAATRIR